MALIRFYNPETNSYERVDLLGPISIPDYSIGKEKLKPDVLDLTPLKAEILLAAHPIGSLYWSENSTEPSTLFGGTWERVKDKFILAAGDTYSSGATGGEEKHLLSMKEMPYHQHPTPLFGNAGSTSVPWTFGAGKTAAKYKSEDNMGTGKAGQEFYMNDSNSAAEEDEVSTLTGWAGGNEAHNNMPPYITYYCWKRVG